MEIYRVLDMNSEGDENTYLIQWLGDHRNSAQWYTKSIIKSYHPTQLIHIDNFDHTFAQKCSQVRYNLANAVKSSKRRQSSNKQFEESNEPLSQMKANSTAESAEVIRKKGSMTLRHGSDQVMSKARSMMEKEKSGFSVPSSQFKISIFTEERHQNHWAYQNYVDEIVEKVDGTAYKIRWNDGTIAQVSENDLMQRESVKLCQFWEGKLRLAPSKKLKQ